MTHNKLARSLAVAAATLAGLGLLVLGFHTVSAQTPFAPPAGPAAAQTWHVNNTPGDGLVGYWKFDQVFDGASYNSALLSNTSVLSGGVSISTTVPPTVTAPDPGSLQLDGVNGLAVISDAASLDVAPSAFSLAAWVRRAAPGVYNAIYDSGTQSNKWWVFIADGSAGKNNRFGFGVRGITETYSTRAITDTGWHHLAVVISGTSTNNVSFYVDGAASGSATVATIVTPSGSKRIGALLAPGLSSFFKGNIDEVRLYNRALSPAEIARLAAGRLCATDGLTWPTAFQDLQCALDTAVVHNGDQIWVAGGTYRPGTDRTSSFHLFNNVPILGGFTGNETSPAQRPAFNPDAPLTILSGDSAGNDPLGSFAKDADNACNVVMAGSQFIPGGISAGLDGLAIQGGHAASGAGCNTFVNIANGGGLANVSPNQLLLNNVVFRLNETNGQGGGLFNRGGRLTLTSVRFISNTADGGGGLAVGGGIVTVTTSAFVSNTANQGGALAVLPAAGPAPLPITVTIASSSFTTNSAQDGGAVETQVGDRLLELSIDQADFGGNFSTGGDGGAISSNGFATGTVRTRISRSTFLSNTAEEDGGAIQSSGEQLTITGSTFTSNASSFSAGGALSARSVVTINNSSFLSNSALAGGGALQVLGQLALAGSNVSFNKAFDTNPLSTARQMGAGALVSGSAAVSDTTFSGNLAFLSNSLSDNQANGGGLAVDGILALSGGVFFNNGAAEGGAVNVHGSASITRSLFQLNFAHDGGAIYVDGDLDLFSSRLLANEAVGSSLSILPGNGGGVFQIHGNLSNHISNNLFVGNVALCPFACSGHGGALNLNTFIALVSNNTIVFRSAIPFNPGSAATLTGTTIGLFNNIITSYTVGLESLGGTIFDDYNLFSGETLTATGVISSLGHSRVAAPRFVNSALDDYHLRLASPAIDAGENDRLPLAVTADLDGGPRFVNVPSVPDTGAGAPPIVDIGAFEVNDVLFLPLTIR